MPAQARLVPSGLDVGQGQEMEQDGFDEMPVLGAAGEERTEGELVAFGLVKVDGGEIALAGGGDVETEAKVGGVGAWSVGA